MIEKVLRNQLTNLLTDAANVREEKELVCDIYSI